MKYGIYQDELIAYVDVKEFARGTTMRIDQTRYGRHFADIYGNIYYEDSRNGVVTKSKTYGQKKVKTMMMNHRVEIKMLMVRAMFPSMKDVLPRNVKYFDGDAHNNSAENIYVVIPRPKIDERVYPE